MEILDFDLFFFSLIFFLPAYVANAMPVIVSGLKITPSLAKPINTKLFGESKTYRGFIFGVLFGCIAGIIFTHNGYSYYYIYENEYNYILLTFLLAFGALFGDLVKSFIKRRIGKKSGEPWIIFDQIDYVIGGLLFGSIILVPPIETIIILLIISPLFSLLANMIAYKLKLKKVWW